MRKVVYSMMVSLDGFVETPDHKLDWVIVDEEIHSFANAEARHSSRCWRRRSTCGWWTHTHSVQGLFTFVTSAQTRDYSISSNGQQRLRRIVMQKITPFLWFDNQAEEAANLYISLFKDSKITGITHYGEGSLGPAGSVMTVTFQLAGQEFTALNGGPHFKFTEAISFFVHCETQEEVDRLWERLTAGGEESQCGWLKDKYGVSWQIVPNVLPELLNDPDPAKARRVLEAMLPMKKIEIAKLKEAHAGK